MKYKNKLITTLALGIIGFGITYQALIITTSCGEDTTDGVIDESHLQFSDDNTTVLGFVGSQYQPKWGSKLQIPAVHNGVNVTTIYHGAFNYCDKLTSVSLPATIISIQDSAFLSCTGLTGELEIPSGVETIEKDTFNGCKHLNSVTFVGKLKSIGETAFYYCEKINSYKFADAQTTELAIGKYAFYGSASIGSIRGCNNNKTYLDAILLNMKQNGSLFDGEGGWVVWIT